MKALVFGLLLAPVIIAVIGAVFIILITMAFQSGNMGDYPAVWANYDKTDMQELFGTPLPEEATDFHIAALSYGQALQIGVRFQIPKNPEVLQPFLTKIGFEHELEPSHKHHPNFWFLPGQDWWNPDQDTSHIGGSFSYSSGGDPTFVDVLIDQNHPNYDVVYLMKEIG